MNLFAAGTGYPALERKYRGFTAPTVRIEIGGVEITRKLGARVCELEVELSSDYPASGCSFELIGEYEPGQSDFRQMGAARLLQLGARVEVSLGYIETEPVFYGLIAEVSYVFDDEAEPALRVECLDAKVLLMKTRRLEIFSEDTLSQAVGSLLSEQPVSSYLRGREVSYTGGAMEPVHAAMETDYAFLVRQAQYVGCEFFILNGTAYFRRPPSAASPILTLGRGEGLLSARVTLRGEGLIKRLTVAGVDPSSDREVSGSAELHGRFCARGTVSQMIGDAERAYFEPRVHNAEQAVRRAQVLMEDIQNGFGRVQGRCVGLPELVPGRFLRLDGLGTAADGCFYLTAIRHVLGAEGFYTEFEARMDSL